MWFPFSARHPSRRNLLPSHLEQGPFASLELEEVHTIIVSQFPAQKLDELWISLRPFQYRSVRLTERQHLNSRLAAWCRLFVFERLRAFR